MQDIINCPFREIHKVIMQLTNVLQGSRNLNVILLDTRVHIFLYCVYVTQCLSVFIWVVCTCVIGCLYGINQWIMNNISALRVPTEFLSLLCSSQAQTITSCSTCRILICLATLNSRLQEHTVCNSIQSKMMQLTLIPFSTELSCQYHSDQLNHIIYHMSYSGWQTTTKPYNHKLYSNDHNSIHTTSQMIYQSLQSSWYHKLVCPHPTLHPASSQMPEWLWHCHNYSVVTVHFTLQHPMIIINVRLCLLVCMSFSQCAT